MIFIYCSKCVFEPRGIIRTSVEPPAFQLSVTRNLREGCDIRTNFFRSYISLAYMLEKFRSKLDERYESRPQLLKIPWSGLIQAARRQRIDLVEIASID